MDDSKLRFGVGVLVIASIGIAIILTFLFGAFPAIFNDEYSLTVVFPSAAGINTNTPVLRDGVTIGRVEGITLRDQGGVELTLAMDANFPLSHRYIPQIGIGSLITGDSKLEFRKADPKELATIYKDDPSLIELNYGNQELFKYGLKLDDPFTMLFGMEDELTKTFRSIRGAGEAVQDIGMSIQGLVRDVRNVIGVESNTPPAINPTYPSSGISRPSGHTLALGQSQAMMPPPPSWATPVVMTVSSRASGESPVQQVVFQNQGGFAIPPGSSLQPGISPGMTTAQAPQPMPGVAQPTIKDLTSEAIVTLEEIQFVVRDVRAILENEQLRASIAATAGKLPGAIDEATTTLRSAQTTFESFRRAGDEFEQVGSMAQTALKEVQPTLASFRGVAENVEEFTAPLGARGEELVEQVLKTLASVDGTLYQIETFGQALNNSDGTLRRVIEDDELYFEVKRVVANIEAATAKVRPILDDVRVFTDKIARDPRQLGVRGALDARPSGMGLK